MTNDEYLAKLQLLREITQELRAATAEDPGIAARNNVHIVFFFAMQHAGDPRVFGGAHVGAPIEFVEWAVRNALETNGCGDVLKPQLQLHDAHLLQVAPPRDNRWN